MRLLITGSNGFIATNFREYLCKHEEVEVQLFDLAYGQDLTCWEDVEEAWASKPDSVVNFASFTHIDDSIKKPQKFWNNNITLMRNVLEACRIHDTRLLQISSSEVYGSAQYIGKYICKKCDVIKYVLPDGRIKDAVQKRSSSME